MPSKLDLVVYFALVFPVFYISAVVNLNMTTRVLFRTPSPMEDVAMREISVNPTSVSLTSVSAMGSSGRGDKMIPTLGGQSFLESREEGK